MMLAAELTLGGVDVAVIERRASQDLPGSRSGGLHSRTIEVLDQRGVADRFLAEGCAMQVQAFAGIPLDISDFLPATTTGWHCGRTTSSGYWPPGSASWGCRSHASVR